MSIAAFGLLVLVAVAVANPIEEEDETNDELAVEQGDQSESICRLF